MKIKICGLSRIEDIQAINAAQPDYAGFVMAESRRRVDAVQAARMRAALDDRIPVVGVFVNAPREEIVRLCMQGTINLVQLHGDEDQAYITALKHDIPNPVICAIRVQSTEQILLSSALPCEYLLFDTFQPGAHGGTGAGFDHSLIPPLTKPFFLAGGIDEHNIITAAKTGAYCIDVSSGVETDGVKDKDKINQIIQIVRRLSL